MDFTGERFHPDCIREIWYEHWHRYAFARHLVNDKTVYDIACGEGYGSNFLSNYAKSVSGFDISIEAIEHAKNTYGKQNNLHFAQANCINIPVNDSSCDVIVSYETLEHIREHQLMMAEFKRILKPDGLLVISSPNKKTYSDDRDYKNEYHLLELYKNELLELLDAYFPEKIVLGQKLMFQSMIWEMNAPNHGQIDLTMLEKNKVVEQSSCELEPLYYIVCCSMNEESLPKNIPDLSLFSDFEESVYAHYNHEIGKNMKAGQLLIERDQKIVELEYTICQLQSKLLNC